MIVVICPGIHPPELTVSFVANLEKAIATTSANPASALRLWVLPPEIAPYGPQPIHDFVAQRWQNEQWPAETPVVWVGFSAGVVGAVAAARQWQRQGGAVRGMIAIDGWGVPLGDRFPRFRLSHDRFTAQSCEWLGASDGYFYCDPAVAHLALWRSPHQSQGYWQPNENSSFGLNPLQLGAVQPVSAAQVIAQLLSQLCTAENV